MKGFQIYLSPHQEVVCFGFFYHYNPCGFIQILITSLNLNYNLSDLIIYIMKQINMQRHKGTIHEYKQI